MTVTVAIPGPRCVHCGGAAHVVTDGPAPAVCRPCLRKLAKVAANPYAICPEGRQALLDRSLDVLDLRDGRWVWTSLWPGTMEARCLDGHLADGKLPPGWSR